MEGMMERCKWTTREEQRLCEMVAAGRSYGDIAEELGRTEIAIRSRINELRRKNSDVPRHNHRWSDRDTEIMLQMLAAGFSAKQVSEVLKASVGAVYNKISALKRKYDEK